MKEIKVCRHCYKDFYGLPFKLYCGITCENRAKQIGSSGSTLDKVLDRWDLLFRLADQETKEMMIKVEEKIPLA